MQFLSPSHRKGVIKLERLQKRFASMSLGLVGLSYRERLGRHELWSVGYCGVT